MSAAGTGAKTGDVLAQLIAQGRSDGADLVTLRGIAEEAGELGAARAMTRLGLADEGAHADVAELRELLKAWRDAKRSAWKAVIGWVMQLFCMLVLAGIAVKLSGGWPR